MTRNNNVLVSRRVVLAGAAGFAVAPWIAGPAAALTTSEAKSLIDKMVAELNRIINSGKSQTAMFADFERLFAKYGDVAIIARTALGPPARTASKSDLRAYTQAFQRYMAVKYGKRFREFIGGKIEVQRAEPWKSHFQVYTKTTKAGSAPFSVVFRVSDKSGKDKMFDMLIEGISLLKSEGVEIRALYDKNGRNMKRLIAALNAYS